MSEQINQLHYDRLVEEALRGVVRRVLIMTAEKGLPGGHHFYITFRTAYPGVKIPQHLREKHPEDMTIVLQHQFWGLEVDERGFSVTLTFNRINERLEIPFAAVSGFTDPSSKFGLQFHVETKADDDATTAPAATAPTPLVTADAPKAKTKAAERNAEEADSAKIVALDAFRKK